MATTIANIVTITRPSTSPSSLSSTLTKTVHVTIIVTILLRLRLLLLSRRSVPILATLSIVAHLTRIAIRSKDLGDVCVRTSGTSGAYEPWERHGEVRLVAP